MASACSAALPRLVCLLTLSLFSCKKEQKVAEIPPGPVAAKLLVPGNFPAVPDDPENPLTEQGITLGRMLFYEKRLSGNNKISCASCHQPELAFTDGKVLSDLGASGKLLSRHAPALFNLAWAKNGLFWDGGSKNLESQALGPLTSADEMAQDLHELESELRAMPDYVQRFNAAFKDGINTSNVVKALAQFQRTLISGNAAYDRYMRKEAGAVLSVQELEGMRLVASRCKGCHAGELFTDHDFHNNGLDNSFSPELEGIYLGRFRVTFDPADLGKFKTPSLRNIMVTAPYMHDGRFKNINQVLDHYQSGIKHSSTTDPLLCQDQGKAGIPLTNEERKAVIAFLNTLTDQEFLTSKQLNKFILQ